MTSIARSEKEKCRQLSIQSHYCGNSQQALAIGIFEMASLTSVPTQLYGRRILPQVLDELADLTPERLYAAIPRSNSDLSQGFRDVSFKEMSNGANYLAHWIRKHCGQSQAFETICYIGIPDLRSAAVFLAAVKCGYKV